MIETFLFPNSYAAEASSSSQPTRSRIRTLSSSSDPARDTPSPTSSFGGSAADSQCIDQLNASLFELQSEIKRLSLQQEQLKSQQMQSQFSQPPQQISAQQPDFSQTAPVFSPPRPEMLNAGFVGYNPQALSSPYPPPYPHPLPMPGQLNPTVPQPGLSPGLGPGQGPPIMMPTFSPSLNNLVQQPPLVQHHQPLHHPPQPMPLQSAMQYGSMVSLTSGATSPMPPYYMSQGNLNINNNNNNSAYSEAPFHLANDNENRTSSAEIGGRMSTASMYASHPNVDRVNSTGSGAVEAFDVTSTTTDSRGKKSSSSGASDVPSPGSQDADRGFLPNSPHAHSRGSTDTQSDPRRRYISFGSDGNDHVAFGGDNRVVGQESNHSRVDRWNRGSESDGGAKEMEEEEDEVTLMNDVSPRSSIEQRSPRAAVAWMTPPSSAGKVRESLAMQTPTSTNSTLSVSDTRRTPSTDRRTTPSTDESTENIKPITPELPIQQLQQPQQQQHDAAMLNEQQLHQRSRVPQPCVMLLDASGKPHEVVDLETQEMLPGNSGHGG